MGRNKQERTNLHARVALSTSDELKQIAFEFGYIHGGEGSIGQLLDAIANREITLSSAKSEDESSKAETSYGKQELESLVTSIVSKELSKYFPNGN